MTYIEPRVSGARRRAEFRQRRLDKLEARERNRAEREASRLFRENGAMPPGEFAREIQRRAHVPEATVSKLIEDGLHDRTWIITDFEGVTPTLLIPL